jgi:hypothetical protein
MKKHFDKAFEPKRERKVKKTYRYKHFAVNNILLVPIMYLAAAEDWLRHYFRKKRVWSDKRTERILAYAFPKVAEVIADENILTCAFRNWHFCNTWCYRCRWWDRKYARKFDDDITDYLMKNFEMEGYTKTVEPEEYGEWTWVTFKKNQ